MVNLSVWVRKTTSQTLFLMLSNILVTGSSSRDCDLAAAVYSDCIDMANVLLWLCRSYRSITTLFDKHLHLLILTVMIYCHLLSQPFFNKSSPLPKLSMTNIIIFSLHVVPYNSNISWISFEVFSVRWLQLTAVVSCVFLSVQLVCSVPSCPTLLTLWCLCWTRRRAALLSVSSRNWDPKVCIHSDNSVWRSDQHVP